GTVVTVDMDLVHLQRRNLLRAHLVNQLRPLLELLGRTMLLNMLSTMEGKILMLLTAVRKFEHNCLTFPNVRTLGYNNYVAYYQYCAQQQQQGAPGATPPPAPANEPPPPPPPPSSSAPPPPPPPSGS